MKIANRITLSYLVVTAILASVALYIVSLIVSDHLRKDVFAHLATAAQSRANHVVYFLEEHRRTVELLASDALLKDVLRTIIGNTDLDSAGHIRVTLAEMASAELKEALEAEEHFSAVFVLNPDGKIIMSTEENHIGLDRSADDCFLEGRKRTYIKDAYYSEMNKKESIAVATPVLDDKEKRLLGVFVVQIELTGLYTITVDRTGLGETGETYLINKDGYMITPSRFREDTFLKEKVDSENSRECRRDLEEYGSRARELDEREKQEEDIRIFWTDPHELHRSEGCN